MMDSVVGKGSQGGEGTKDWQYPPTRSLRTQEQDY